MTSEDDRKIKRSSLEDVEGREVGARKRVHDKGTITEGKKFFKIDSYNDRRLVHNTQPGGTEFPSLQVGTFGNPEEHKEVYRENEGINTYHHIRQDSKRNCPGLDGEHMLVSSSANYEENVFPQKTEVQLNIKYSPIKGRDDTSTTSQFIDGSTKQNELVRTHKVLSLYTTSISISLKQNKEAEIKKSMNNATEKNVALSSILGGNDQIQMDSLGFKGQDMHCAVLSSSKNHRSNNNLKGKIFLPSHFKHLCKVASSLDKALNILISRNKETTYEALKEYILKDMKVYYIPLILIDHLQ